jgi:hypothetical protein
MSHQAHASACITPGWNQSGTTSQVRLLAEDAGAAHAEGGDETLEIVH